MKLQSLVPAICPIDPPKNSVSIESDPIELPLYFIGLIGGLNAYAYVYSSPLIGHDESGLEPTPGAWGVGVRNSYIAGMTEAMYEYVKMQTITGMVGMGLLTLPSAVTAAAASAPAAICGIQSLGYASTPIVLNPVVQQNAIDFVEGYWLSGPPPMSPAGIAGFFTSASFDEFLQNK